MCPGSSCSPCTPSAATRARNNELIFSLPSRYPNVQLIDWNTAVGSCPGDCLYEDGIHLPPDGRRYYAQLIFDQIGI